MIQKQLKELTERTLRLSEEVRNAVGRPESLNIGEVVAYGDLVKSLHKAFSSSVFADESSSGVGKFFNEWNNMVFGILYVTDMARDGVKLTENHVLILAKSLEGIIIYTEKADQL